MMLLYIHLCFIGQVMFFSAITHFSMLISLLRLSICLMLQYYAVLYIAEGFFGAALANLHIALIHFSFMVGMFAD